MKWAAAPWKLAYVRMLHLEVRENMTGVVFTRGPTTIVLESWAEFRELADEIIGEIEDARSKVGLEKDAVAPKEFHRTRSSQTHPGADDSEDDQPLQAHGED